MIRNLDKLKKIRVLVIGDLIVDKYIYGEVNRISPEAPVPTVEVKEKKLSLGGAANVINNIVSLDSKAYAFGIVGKDNEGKWLIKNLKKKGVNVEGILEDVTRPTTTKSRIMAGNHQIVRLDFEVTEEVNEKITDEMIKKLDRIIDQVNIIVISDYDKGVMTKKLIQNLMEKAHSQNKKILVDPKLIHHLDYKGADIIKTNLRNASIVTGIQPISRDKINKIGKKVCSILHTKQLILTQEREGMSIFEDGKQTHIPTFTKDVFDVTGAGDVVAAVTAVSLASGASLYEAAKLANIAAGIVVGKLGTYAVKKQEILKILKKDEQIENN